MPVIVVGSANMDLVVRTPSLPQIGQTVAGTNFRTVPGGKGANQAVAAAKLGACVRFAGRVGADAFGGILRASLTAAGADVSMLQVDDERPTGVALITVDDLGQNTIAVVSGANGRFEAATEESFGDPGDVLLAQLEVPLDQVEKAFRQSRARTKILNPAPGMKLPESLIANVSLITPNETEAEVLTGIPVGDPSSAEKAADQLIAQGASAAIITLGSKGCLYRDRSECRHYPAMNVKAVDTVAAGDAFSGALAAFIDRGSPIDEAIHWATATAALSTTRAGAQDSMPILEEVLLFAGGR